MTEEVTIEKLVHGGQGIARLADGRKVFVWNALPGERLSVRITRNRRDYAEAVTESVIKASPDRVKPRDEAYLSTSPWQIIAESSEDDLKQSILAETLTREGINFPIVDFEPTREFWNYRNKMEYSFWGDDDGLHLALFHRASHGKRIVDGSSIARTEIDQTAQAILAILNNNGIRASQLKTLIVRVNTTGEVVAALFTKDDNFKKIPALSRVCHGLVVVFSTPKSPASVVTKTLYQYGNLEIQESIGGVSVSYNVFSFFQVNISVFLQALEDIKQAVLGQKHLVDMYSGVGSIGLAVGAETLVELDEDNAKMATKNSTGSDAVVVRASAEKALEYIAPQACIIFDPPRSGLHKFVIDRLLEAEPKLIIYLSCNPATQARDIGRLTQSYTVLSCKGYNFFPRTPHIESLVVLKKTGV